MASLVARRRSNFTENSENSADFASRSAQIGIVSREMRRPSVSYFLPRDFSGLNAVRISFESFSLVI